MSNKTNLLQCLIWCACWWHRNRSNKTNLRSVWLCVLAGCAKTGQIKLCFAAMLGWVGTETGQTKLVTQQCWILCAPWWHRNRSNKTNLRQCLALCARWLSKNRSNKTMFCGNVGFGALTSGTETGQTKLVTQQCWILCAPWWRRNRSNKTILRQCLAWCARWWRRNR